MHLVLTCGKLVQIDWHLATWVWRNYNGMLCHVFILHLLISWLCKWNWNGLWYFLAFASKGQEIPSPYLHHLPPGHRCVNLFHSSYDLSVGALQKFLSTLKPSRNWGPVDTIYRHWWVQWRVTCNKTGQRDFTFKRRGTKDYTSSIQKYHTTDPAGTYRATPSSANGTLQHNRGTNRGPFTIQTNGDLPEHVCWRGTLQQSGDGTW